MKRVIKNKRMLTTIAIMILLILGVYSIMTFLKSQQYLPYEREEPPQYATGLVEIYFLSNIDDDPVKAEEKIIMMVQSTNIPILIKESKNSNKYIVVSVPPGKEEEYIQELNKQYPQYIQKIGRYALRTL